MSVAAYRVGDTAYHFITLAPAGRSGVFDRLIGSFRVLSAQEAAGLRQRRVQVVNVRQGDTFSSMANLMAVENLRAEWFAMLNNLRPGEALQPGRPVKIIAYDR
jgi:predicted Zn-dependent protease